MPAPMPFDAPVTTATLPASFPIFPVLFRSALTGRPWSVTSIVRKYGTVEQRFKGLYLQFCHAPVASPFRRRHPARGDPPRARRSGARGDLRRDRGGGLRPALFADG